MDIIFLSSDVSCPKISPDCSGASPSLMGVNSLDFSFLSCATPSVTSISTTSGTADTVIVINGTGFGTMDCQNHVHFGDFICNVTSSSEASIECVLDTHDIMAVGVGHEINVGVGSLGMALNAIDDVAARRYVLLPHVESLSPVLGSVAGGTVLNITGSGFVSGLTSVMIDGVLCAVSSVTYTSITCVTGSAWETTAELVVSVYSGQWIPAQCTSSCMFTYSLADTPQVDTVSPSTISVVYENVTITGTGFATDAADVTLYIGDTECIVVSSTPTEIICSAGVPIAGQQPLSVFIQPNGHAMLSVSTIMVSPGIPTIHPDSGSLEGGTNATISGFGFSDSDTTVYIGGEPCLIQRISDAYLECITPAGPEGPADVQVTSNGFTYTTMTFTHSVSLTADLISLSSNTASPGDTLTISANNMLENDTLVTVQVGDSPCDITAISTTSIDCTLGEHEAGSVNVSVHVHNWGYATGDLTFTYALSISDVIPNTGTDNTLPCYIYNLQLCDYYLRS